MARFVDKNEKKKGMAPGSLIFTGKKKMDAPGLALIRYNNEETVEKKAISSDETLLMFSGKTTSWINIDGLHDIELFNKLGEKLALHPLLLEDILHTEQRPKFVEFDNCIFITLKNITLNEKKMQVQTYPLYQAGIFNCL